MFRNLLEILHSAVKQRNTDMSLLECADIVRAVPSHERDKAECLQSRQDEFLLSGRNAGVDPSILDEVKPGRSRFVLLHGGACNTDIVFVEEARVSRDQMKKV